MQEDEFLRARVEAELRDQGLSVAIGPLALAVSPHCEAPRTGGGGRSAWRRSSNDSQSWKFAGSLVTARNLEVLYRGSVVSFRTSWPGRGSTGTAGMVPSRPAW